MFISFPRQFAWFHDFIFPSKWYLINTLIELQFPTVQNNIKNKHEMKNWENLPPFSVVLSLRPGTKCIILYYYYCIYD